MTYNLLQIRSIQNHYTPFCQNNTNTICFTAMDLIQYTSDFCFPFVSVLFQDCVTGYGVCHTTNKTRLKQRHIYVYLSDDPKTIPAVVVCWCVFIKCFFLTKQRSDSTNIESYETTNEDTQEKRRRKIKHRPNCWLCFKQSVKEEDEYLDFNVLSTTQGHLRTVKLRP